MIETHSLYKDGDKILLDKKFKRKGNNTSFQQKRYSSHLIESTLSGTDILEKIEEQIQGYELFLSDILLALLVEMVENSIDANAKTIRVAVKYNQEIKRLLFFVADDGDGKKAKQTNDKKKGEETLGGEGLGIKSFDEVSGGTFRLMRYQRGTTASFTLNTDTYKDDIHMYGVKKTNPQNTQQKQMENHTIITRVMELWKLHGTTEETPFDYMRRIYGEEFTTRLFAGQVTQDELEKHIQKHSTRVASSLKKVQ